MPTNNEERRKSFIMYMSHRTMFEATTPEQCQELILKIFDFAETGIKANDITDPLVKICYDQISFLMEVNLKKYEDKCRKISEAKTDYWNKQHELMRLAENIKNAKNDPAEQLKAVKEYEAKKQELDEIKAKSVFDGEDVPFK